MKFINDPILESRPVKDKAGAFYFQSINTVEK